MLDGPFSATRVPARVVVLGGGFAGVLAAGRIARAMQGSAEVRLVSEHGSFVERVRLHQLATGQTIARPGLETLLAMTGACFTQGRVVEIALDRRVVRLERENHTECLPYDVLVCALGSTVDVDTVPGARTHCETIAGEAAARRMNRRLTSVSRDGGGDVVVCGGGLTGIELSTEIAAQYPDLRVALVTEGELGQAFSKRGTAYVRCSLERLGIAVHERSRIEEVEEASVRLLGGARLRFDACAWAASFGVSPLARSAGLEVDDRGRIVVDASLRSVSHPEVFGAGDCAVPLPSVSVPIRMGCATAMPMAAAAADNVVNVLRKRPSVPFRFGYVAQFVSLGRNDALAQFVRFDDTPRHFIVTGPIAASLKELTFRFNLFSLQSGFYPWRLAALGLPFRAGMNPTP